MNQKLLAKLREITTEEQAILEGNSDIQRDLYTDRKDFIIDSQLLLSKGKLIDLRPHTRFVHFPRHRHNYVEIVYMCSGSTTHILNDTDRVVLREGDLLFLNQNITQEIEAASLEDIAVNFIILPEFFDQAFNMMEKTNVLRDFLVSTLSQDTSLTNYLHFQAQDILPVQNLVENMIWSLIEKKSGFNTINQTTMGLLFMNLSAFAENINRNLPNQYEQNLVLAVLKYLDTHYKNGTLADISSELNQETYHISRLLKKHTGNNFKELLQQRKLQQAVYLLKQTPLTVDAIMEAIGYDNSSYFYRKFKEKYHCSPKEYRLQNV